MFLLSSAGNNIPLPSITNQSHCLECSTESERLPYLMWAAPCFSKSKPLKTIFNIKSMASLTSEIFLEHIYAEHKYDYYFG